MSLHFVALGDSTTVGVGDPLGGKEVSRTGAGALPGQGWRGWAALLAEALNSSQTVTFTNLASSAPRAGPHCRTSARELPGAGRCC